MKDIRCLFGCHIYADSDVEVKVVDERKGYLLARVNMFCTRCGKSYEDMVRLPFPEWLQQKSAGPETCEGCKHIVEYVYSSPCTCCKRVAVDNYER